VVTVFLRHHKWAVVTASFHVLAAIPLVLSRLGLYVILFPRFPYRLSSYILVGMHAAALALLVAALGLLWRQWRTLRTRPLAAGAGFDVGEPRRATPDRCPECGTLPTAQAARPGGAGG
jgi:hypothetical protein